MIGEKTVKRATFVVVLWLIPTAVALGGPPFRTDDPVPMDYHHGEVYLFSTATREAGGTSGLKDTSSNRFSYYVGIYREF